MRSNILILLSVLFAGNLHADGFRCGSRLVVNGDPVSRLVRYCGQPEMKFQARAGSGKNNKDREQSVVNWVYDRGRKPDMIVSVRHGKVVRIRRE